MVEADVMALHGNSTNGPIHWLLHSPWAPLLFALWCHNIHPRHPRYLSDTWLPAGWRQRAATLRPVPVRPVEPVRPQINA
jgi:hypothetical protein